MRSLKTFFWNDQQSDEELELDEYNVENNAADSDDSSSDDENELEPFLVNHRLGK